jgi:subtilisin family serine protease
MGPPATLPGVLSVGATTRSGGVLRMSDAPSAADPVLSAPGEAILTTRSGGGYTHFSGTSAATAFVTGALALLRQYHGHHPGAPGPGAFTDALRATARPVAGQVPPHDARAGFGLLQADAADAWLRSRA